MGNTMEARDAAEATAEAEKEMGCPCGSGLSRRDLTDARGIFCAFVCDRCEAEKRSRYRADIFINGAYWADEPIEED